MTPRNDTCEGRRSSADPHPHDTSHKLLRKSVLQRVLGLLSGLFGIGERLLTPSLRFQTLVPTALPVVSFTLPFVVFATFLTFLPAPLPLTSTPRGA